MKDDIIFIGGIHSVGKGTLCKNVTSGLNVIHLAASETLSFEQVKEWLEKHVPIKSLEII